MNKFVVTTDLDGCLNNLTEQVFNIYNSRYGTNYTIEDANRYYYDECFPLDVSEKMRALFKEKELWDSLSPIDGSQWGIKTLINNGYKVYVATATDYVNFAWKVDWMKKYFPFIDEKNIIRIHDKSLLKTDVLIEDCYENLTSLCSITDRVLLDYPWNQANKDKDYIYGINRAYNWEEIVRFVNKIYKEMEW